MRKRLLTVGETVVANLPEVKRVFEMPKASAAKY